MGALDWLPNRDSARWLLGAIWPAVLAREPDARLTIVGRGATAGSIPTDLPGVAWMGEVPEVESHLRKARALLVPLRAGAGVRIKILEAMGAGTPVITTPQGVAGISAVEGKHYLLARNADEFASAVVRIHRDPELARQLGHSAREWAHAHHGMSTVRERLDQALRIAVGSEVPA